MAVSLNHHFKYAITVGHPSPPTALNSLLKVTSVTLILVLLIKLLQDYNQSTGLTLEEAKLILDRPFAVLLVTDISAVRYQVMQENDDLQRSDDHYSYLCTSVGNVFSVSSNGADYQCVKFAEALSIPVNKFEVETYRNQHEMVRLREAKITRVIFEDAVASFFVNALHDYVRYLKVDARKWSLFNDRVMDIDTASKRPLILINSDGFLLRFARAMVSKQPAPFLNFLVIDDDQQRTASFENSTTKSNYTLFMQQSVLNDCKMLKSCFILRKQHLTDGVANSFVNNIFRNLSVVHAQAHFS